MTMGVSFLMILLQIVIPIITYTVSGFFIIKIYFYYKDKSENGETKSKVKKEKKEKTKELKENQDNTKEVEEVKEN